MTTGFETLELVEEGERLIALYTVEPFGLHRLAYRSVLGENSSARCREGVRVSGRVVEARVEPFKLKQKFAALEAG